MESFNSRFLAILACVSSEAIRTRRREPTLRFLAQLRRTACRPLGAKHDMHGITEVQYESCWRLARTTLKHDVSVTSFFLSFSRYSGSLTCTERSIYILNPAPKVITYVQEPDRQTADRQRRQGRAPRFLRGVSSSPHTVHLCLGVRGPGIAALRSTVYVSCSTRKLFCLFCASVCLTSAQSGSPHGPRKAGPGRLVVPAKRGALRHTARHDAPPNRCRYKAPTSLGLPGVPLVSPNRLSPRPSARLCGPRCRVEIRESETTITDKSGKSDSYLCGWGWSGCGASRLAPSP